MATMTGKRRLSTDLASKVADVLETALTPAERRKVCETIPDRDREDEAELAAAVALRDELQAELDSHPLVQLQQRLARAKAIVEGLSLTPNRRGAAARRQVQEALSENDQQLILELDRDRHRRITTLRTSTFKRPGDYEAAHVEAMKLQRDHGIDHAVDVATSVAAYRRQFGLDKVSKTQAIKGGSDEGWSD